MTTGDKIPENTPRFVSNERLDVPDATRLAEGPRTFDAGLARALLTTPRATAGSPTGERWTGSITANPTGASDGLVRLDSPAFVGVDANGGLVIKPAGTTISTPITAGGAQYQVYAYVADVAQDTQVRRYLPVTSPFTEFSSATDVSNVQTVNLYTRAGGAGSIVASDAVAGVTRALLFLGIATNLVGVVTFTPAANTLETVTAPATEPATSSGTTTVKTTVTGSLATLRDLAGAALYHDARTRWKSSTNLTANAANNFGAYVEPAGGVDAAFRGRTVITIGRDSAGVYGDYDLDKYAGAESNALAAAIAAAKDGDTITLRAGVTLTLSADVTIPADKSLRITGCASNNFDNASTIDMVTFKFACAASTVSGTALALENLYLFSTNATAAGTFLRLHNNWNVTLRGCSFVYGSVFAGAGQWLVDINTGATQALLGSFLAIDCAFTYANAATSGFGGAFSTGSYGMGHVRFRDCNFINAGTLQAGQLIVIDVREDFVVDRCQFVALGTGAAASTTLGVEGIRITCTDNTLAKRVRRRITNCTFVGTTGSARNLIGISVVTAVAVYVGQCTFVDCVRGAQYTVGATMNADWTIEGCVHENAYGPAVSVSITAGQTLRGFRHSNNVYRTPTGVGPSTANGNVVISGGAGAGVERVVSEGNAFYDTVYALNVVTVSGLRHQRNRHLRDALTDFYPLSFDGGAGASVWTDIAIDDNEVIGCQLPTTASGAMLDLRCSSLNGSISRNLFDNIDNVTYSGATTMDHAVLRVRANSIQDVQIAHNRFDRIATGLLIGGGGATNTPILIEVDSQDRATSAAQGTVLAITGNRSNDDTGEVVPVVIRHHPLKACTIDGNAFVYCHDEQIARTPAGNARADLDIQTTTIDALTVVNNTWRCLGNGLAALTTHAVLLTGTFSATRFQANTWAVGGAFGFATTKGINFAAATFVYLQFDHNQALILGDPTLNNSKFNYVAYAAATTSAPAQPAGAAYWGNSNQNIGRN